MKLSEAQMWLVDYLQKHVKLTGIEPEFRFDPVRKWRFDVALPEHRVAFEIDGATWSHGRHTRGKGFIADMEKLNRATASGWRVFRFTPQQVLDGTAKKFIEEYL